MKLEDLSAYNRETIEHVMRDHSHSKIREDLQIPPTEMQCLRLRFGGYVVGPNNELLRIDCHGDLRECCHGIPCYHHCCGYADGKCSVRPFPSDGVPTGKLNE